MTNTMTLPASAERPVASRTTLARGAAIGAGVALLANLVIYLIGNAGAPIRVVTGWQPDGADLTFAEVVIATIVWVTIGAAALWLMERHLTRGFHRWTVLAAVITLASLVPLFALDVDTASLLALSFMHIVVGASTIAGQSFVVRPRRQGAP
jgi:Family of unknown function (DUF6069)